MSPEPPIVIVERPATPLLWLDTSILIAQARAEKGTGWADQRVVDLVELLEEKRQAGKLLCVESDQPREVEGHPRASTIRQTLRQLTYNVRLRSRLELDRFQVGEAMRAYLAGSQDVALPVRVFFRDDPDAQIRTVNERGWFLTVDSDMHPEVLSRAKQSKQNTHTDLEQLRQKNRAAGRGYDEQLASERSGFLEGQRAILLRLAEELRSPSPDVMTVMAGSPLRDHLRTWDDLGGDADQALQFFQSEHFLRLPCNDIPFRLYAQLLTIDRPVESGDAMDIQHMACALPIARWVLTDRSLANRVQQLGLDSTWGCSAYSLRSIDDLVEEVRGL